MKFTKETAKRMTRTFIQAAVAYIVANLAVVDFSEGKDVIKSALIGLLVSAIAAGLSAAMNLQTSTETGSGGSMTYDSFVSHYLGKSTDWDGAYGTQCVDLIKAYLYEVFGIKAGSWGNAKYYWINFNLHSELKNSFTKIAYTKGMAFNKGDIVVWNGNAGAGCGHVAIATGEYSSSGFYTYDQNWNVKEMKKVWHGYSNVYGVLRPKNQSNITTVKSVSGTGSYPTPADWKNGSTEETVYKQNDFKGEIGFLSPKESAKCYSKAGDAYVVVYSLDGTSKHKTGFVKYAGGVKKAPPESKTWTNGSTSETVYADTSKKTKVGSVNPRGQAYCLGRIDGMYLVLYKVSGTSLQKCGFVDYSGGVD